jgi:hypothetical protein
MDVTRSVGDSHAARVRVVLVGCTGLLGDIISNAVTEDPSIEVVARIDAPRLADDRSIEADLLVWNNADETEVSRWLSDVHAAPRVLATVGDGRDAALWELAPQRTELGELSPAALVETIRSAIPHSLEPPDSQETR